MVDVPEKPGRAKRDNKPNDRGNMAKSCLPQDFKLDLAMLRLASTDQEAAQNFHSGHACCASYDRGVTPVNTIWPCLAV